MSEKIDTTNKFLVSAMGGSIAIMRRPNGPMSEADARLLAAWLVALTGGEEKFAPVLEAVENT